MIYRFVVDVQTLGELLKRLAEIVGVGDQESTRAFGQLPQAGLCIRGAHRGDGVVALLAVLPHDAGAGAELTLVLADGCHLVHGQPAGLRGVAGLAHFGGVERVKRDAMAVGIVENLLEPVGVTRGNQTGGHQQNGFPSWQRGQLVDQGDDPVGLVHARNIGEIAAFANLIAAQAIRAAAVGDVRAHEDRGVDLAPGGVYRHAGRVRGVVHLGVDGDDTRAGGEQGFRGSAKIQGLPIERRLQQLIPVLGELVYRDQLLVEIEDADVCFRRQFALDELLDDFDRVRPGDRIDVMEDDADGIQFPQRQRCAGGRLRLAFGFLAVLFLARHHAEAENLLAHAVFVDFDIARLNVFHLAALLVAHREVQRHFGSGDPDGRSRRRGRGCVLGPAGAGGYRHEAHNERILSLSPAAGGKVASAPRFCTLRPLRKTSARLVFY